MSEIPIRQVRLRTPKSPPIVDVVNVFSPFEVVEGIEATLETLVFET